MHLATDYVHPTPRRGACRVRVYLPDEPERDAPVVICSELPANRGQSVTNAVEQIAGEVISNFRLPAPIVWIEHYPPEATDGCAETFDLVVFAHYEIREIARSANEGTIKEIGPPTWKRLDRTSVEVLIGQPLREQPFGAGDTA